MVGMALVYRARGIYNMYANDMHMRHIVVFVMNWCGEGSTIPA